MSHNGAVRFSAEQLCNAVTKRSMRVVHQMYTDLLFRYDNYPRCSSIMDNMLKHQACRAFRDGPRTQQMARSVFWTIEL